MAPLVHEVTRKVAMHVQRQSSIGRAATVPEVQVNQSCGLNTEPHEHVVLKACLRARPSSGTPLCLFLSLRHARVYWNNLLSSSSDKLEKTIETLSFLSAS